MENEYFTYVEDPLSMPEMAINSSLQAIRGVRGFDTLLNLIEKWSCAELSQVASVFSNSAFVDIAAHGKQTVRIDREMINSGNSVFVADRDFDRMPRQIREEIGKLGKESSKRKVVYYNLPNSNKETTVESVLSQSFVSILATHLYLFRLRRFKPNLRLGDQMPCPFSQDAYHKFVQKYEIDIDDYGYPTSRSRISIRPFSRFSSKSCLHDPDDPIPDLGDKLRQLLDDQVSVLFQRYWFEDMSRLVSPTVPLLINSDQNLLLTPTEFDHIDRSESSSIIPSDPKEADKVGKLYLLGPAQVVATTNSEVLDNEWVDQNHRKKGIKAFTSVFDRTAAMLCSYSEEFRKQRSSGPVANDKLSKETSALLPYDFHDKHNYASGLDPSRRYQHLYLYGHDLLSAFRGVSHLLTVGATVHLETDSETALVDLCSSTGLLVVYDMYCCDGVHKDALIVITSLYLCETRYGVTTQCHVGDPYHKNAPVFPRIKIPRISSAQADLVIRSPYFLYRSDIASWKTIVDHFTKTRSYSCSSQFYPHEPNMTSTFLYDSFSHHYTLEQYYYEFVARFFCGIWKRKICHDSLPNPQLSLDNAKIREYMGLKKFSQFVPSIAPGSIKVIYVDEEKERRAPRKFKDKNKKNTDNVVDAFFDLTFDS